MPNSDNCLTIVTSSPVLLLVLNVVSCITGTAG